MTTEQGIEMEAEEGRASAAEKTVQPVESSAAEIGTAPSYLLEADSDARPVVSVVMPTLNEERGIGECIERTKRALAELGLPGEIIVSDSSTDRTPEIAAEHGAIVVRPDEAGYGYAYQYAFERARGEYIAIGDADTTYDFEELPKLFELVSEGEADMAMRSRLEGEIKDGSMPTLHQYIGNPLLTRFLKSMGSTERGASKQSAIEHAGEQPALGLIEMGDTIDGFARALMRGVHYGHRLIEPPSQESYSP